MHAFPDLDVDVTIFGGLVAKVVELDDFFWDVTYLEEEISILLRRSVEVEI